MGSCIRRCLAENLLDWRSSVERLIRSIMVVVMLEPSQPAHNTDWTPPPEGVKALDPGGQNAKIEIVRDDYD